jgi:hypothetical protein
MANRADGLVMRSKTAPEWAMEDMARLMAEPKSTVNADKSGRRDALRGLVYPPGARIQAIVFVQDGKEAYRHGTGAESGKEADGRNQWLDRQEVWLDGDRRDGKESKPKGDGMGQALQTRSGLKIAQGNGKTRF